MDMWMGAFAGKLIPGPLLKIEEGLEYTVCTYTKVFRLIVHFKLFPTHEKCCTLSCYYANSAARWTSVAANCSIGYWIRVHALLESLS